MEGGGGTQTWPLINVQTKTQSHSTNKGGTEYGPTHVLTKTQLQQISLRTNNFGGDGIRSYPRITLLTETQLYKSRLL